MKQLPTSFALDDAQLAEELLAGMTEVEKRLDEYLTHSDLFTTNMTKHLMRAGGKRIRPLLVLISAQFGPDGITDQVIEAAVATELTHLATLYHDDVMDNADLRRGEDSAHIVYGNNAAILAGDLLLAKASMIVSSLGGEALGIQARTFERLCLGQLHEGQEPGEGQDPVEYHLQVISDKTSSLVSTAGDYGVLFSGGDEETREILREYGENVGTAFQLVDDIIDVSSSSNTSGKVRGTDLKEGVPTLPTLLLAEKGTEKENRAIEKAHNGTQEEVAEAIKVLQASDVTEEAWDIARDYAQKAKDVLNPLPESSAKDALQAFAQAMVERDK